MSVITRNNKVVLSGGKALSFDNLVELANATTGETDTTLTDAVQSLIDGYGQGGGGQFIGTNISGACVIVTENIVFPDVYPERPFKIDDRGNLYEGIAGIKTIYVGTGWRRYAERAGQFKGLPDLEKVVLAMPETSYDMFWNCTNLKSVELMDTVETIADWLCEGCLSLQELVVYGDNVKILSGSSILSGANATAKIYVPDNLVSAYKSATNWNAYASRILPMSSRPV